MAVKDREQRSRVLLTFKYGTDLRTGWLIGLINLGRVRVDVLRNRLLTVAVRKAGMTGDDDHRCFMEIIVDWVRVVVCCRFPVFLLSP